VCLTVYFVGGILVMRYGRGARGVEQIPNLEFWKSLPGLVKVVSHTGLYCIVLYKRFLTWPK